MNIVWYFLIMKKVFAITSISIFFLLTSCSQSNSDEPVQTSNDSQTSENTRWSDEQNFLDLMSSLSKSASYYSNKAMTYEEFIESINSISLDLEALNPSDRVNCPNALSKVALEVNQLRVALINQSEQDIRDGWKVVHPTYFMTAFNFCI